MCDTCLTIYNILLTTSCVFFFFNDTATTEIYTRSLHDALPISRPVCRRPGTCRWRRCARGGASSRSEEHTSELQSQSNLVCRLLLEKKKKKNKHELHVASATMCRDTDSKKHSSAPRTCLF